MKVKQIFKRDKRSPVPSSIKISITMSKIRAKNTKPELELRKALFKRNIRGYRVNYPKLPGKPDIVFLTKRIVVFVNGCFWHGCPKCNLKTPKSNSKFWFEKIQRNIERDKENIYKLHAQNYQVYTIWECELKKDSVGTVNKLVKIINE